MRSSPSRRRFLAGTGAARTAVLAGSPASTSAASPSAATDEQIDADIERLVDEAVEASLAEHDVPGASVAVVSGGSRVGGSGFRARSRERSSSPRVRSPSCSLRCSRSSRTSSRRRLSCFRTRRPRSGCCSPARVSARRGPLRAPASPGTAGRAGVGARLSGSSTRSSPSRCSPAAGSSGTGTSCSRRERSDPPRGRPTRSARHPDSGAGTVPAVFESRDTPPERTVIPAHTVRRGTRLKGSAGYSVICNT